MPWRRPVDSFEPSSPTKLPQVGVSLLLLLLLFLLLLLHLLLLPLLLPLHLLPLLLLPHLLPHLLSLLLYTSALVGLALEGPLHELKGAPDHQLTWSLESFRQSFRRSVGRTLVAFLNNGAPASLVYGIYDQSRLVHGIWLDSTGRDPQGCRLHLQDELERSLRDQFRAHYGPRERSSQVLESLRIFVLPLSDGLIGGRHLVVLVQVELPVTSASWRSTWRSKQYIRQGSSTIISR